MKTRVGIGIDAHRFAAGRPLILGGVEIGHHLGLEGHSDADVLSHAIADSLLGAAGLEDIGHYFPDSDPAIAGISSLEILSKVAALIESAGWRIGNVDAVLVLEEPRVAPVREQIRAALAGSLRIAMADVSVRATTVEGMGFTGRKEGIAATAVSLLECQIVREDIS